MIPVPVVIAIEARPIFVAAWATSNHFRSCQFNGPTNSSVTLDEQKESTLWLTVSTKLALSFRIRSWAFRKWLKMARKSMKDFAQSTHVAFEANFTVGVGAVYRLLN